MRIEELCEMKPMIDPETEFKEELRMFGNEVEKRCNASTQGTGGDLFLRVVHGR
jgi:hypothetical protein